MRQFFLRHEFLTLLICFVVSRVIVQQAGIEFQYENLFNYWQYLDVQSLQQNLLRSLWFMHAQPPVFNLFVGSILKIGGQYAQQLFQLVWLLISFCNAYLLLRIVKGLCSSSSLPLVIALFYLLSPATILFENELFYTSFVSMLLLFSVFFLLKFIRKDGRFVLSLFFIFLCLLCLARSLFHLTWLVTICLMLLSWSFRKASFRPVLVRSLLSVLTVSFFYCKNYFLFGVFSLSSWTGLNLSRTVFLGIPSKDSANISSLLPFMRASHYRQFIPPENRQQYAGMADRILLHEMKSDTVVNMNNVDYIPISKQYLRVSLNFIKLHPAVYLKNVLGAALIFFTPATHSNNAEKNALKLGIYEPLYSFDLSILFPKKTNKKYLLAIEAFPKLFMYALVFLCLIRGRWTDQAPRLVILYIAFSIVFVLLVSSLLEFGENMRFRFELEPLFLILVAVVCNDLHETFLSSKKHGRLSSQH